MLFNLRPRRTRRRQSRVTFFEQRIPLQLRRKRRCLRGARKDDSVGYKWKASDTRNDHKLCSIHRRSVLHWLVQISAWVGEVLPVDERKTSVEFRLSKLQPAIRIFVTANTIGVGVAFRGDDCWDLLQCVECEPRRVSGGWIDSLNLPDYQRVYPDLETLWRNEVFEPFEAWFREKLLTAETLAIYCVQEGPRWARLAASSVPVELHEIERLPVRIGYPDLVDLNDHLGTPA
jgi:hypothetical protein